MNGSKHVSDTNGNLTLDPRMLDLLVCPQTRGPLRWDEEAQELVSENARLAFPVRDGVPILLISEGRPLDD